MPAAYRIALALHICAGILGLIAFWTPAVARKGGAVHVQVGRVFFWCTFVVAGTGIVMATLLLVAPLSVHPPKNPVSPEVAAAIATEIRSTAPFLFYLVLITFVPVYHGVRVLATRRAPDQLRTHVHTTLQVTAIAGSTAMIALGIWLRQPVFLGLSPIGFLIGFGNLAFARRPYATPMAWWYEHMNAMLAGGIAYHTAFLVLGAGRLFNVQLDGAWAVVPWLLPTIIGVPASVIWTNYYRRRFKETSAVAVSPAAVAR